MSLCRLRKHVKRNETLNFRTGKREKSCFSFLSGMNPRMMGGRGFLLNVLPSWGKGGRKMGEAWEKPCKAQPLPMLHGGRVGERWGKYGKSQAIPTQCPCYMGDGWEKDGRRLEKPCKAHPMPMLHGARMGERRGGVVYHTKNWTERIRSSSLIIYSVCRFLALIPDTQKLVHLTFAH